MKQPIYWALCFSGLAITGMGSCLVLYSWWGIPVIITGAVVNWIGWLHLYFPPPKRIKINKTPIKIHGEMTDEEVHDALIHNVYVTGKPMVASRKKGGSIEVREIPED